MDTSQTTPKRKYTKRGSDVGKVLKRVAKYLSELESDCLAYCDVHGLNISDFPISFTNITKLIVKMCGVSVGKVHKELKSPVSINDENTSPKSKRGRKESITSTFHVSHIRRICHNFYAQKEYPTIKKLMDTIKENDTNFPNVGWETFRKWLRQKCGFRYKKIHKKCVFLERTDIVAQREHYLRSVRHYRTLGYKVFYQDETWTSPDQSRNQCWQVLLSKKDMNDFKKQYNGKVLSNVNGYSGGFMVKGGKGRVIINHMGSESGFLEGAADIFISSDNSKDYHRSMNSKHWLEWFRRVVHLIPEKSVVVLDQASYHKERVKGTVMPKMHWRKAEILEWFEGRDYELPFYIRSIDMLTKASLIELSKRYPVKEKFVAEQIVEESGKDIKILWLPVSHCELNPIELVWAYLKGKVSERNVVGGTKKVHELTLECINLVTPELWVNCLRHAIGFEEKFWSRDGMIERNMEELQSNPDLVIHLGLDSCDDSCDDSVNEDEEMDLE